MPDIVYGSAQELESGYTVIPTVCEIDTNKFVVAYRDLDDGDAGKARVGTVSGTTITWGDIVEFDSSVSVTRTQLDICKLDTDRFVIAYEDHASGDIGNVVLGNVSNRTISFETPVGFSGANDAEDINCCALSTTKFAIVYNDETGGDVGKVVIATVAGDTITVDTANALTFEGFVANGRCCKLDTDKLVAVYIDKGDNFYPKACVFTVATTTPSAGTIKTIDEVGSYQPNCEQLDTDKFVMTWWDYVNDKGFIEICAVSGGVISEGAEVELNVGDTYFSAITAVEASHFVVVYRDFGNGDKATSRYCSFDGTTITLGTEEVFNDAASRWTDVATINTTKIVAVYMDDADVFDHGEAIIGDTPSEATHMLIDVPLADTVNGATLVPTFVRDMSFAVPLASTVNGAVLTPVLTIEPTINVPLADTINGAVIAPTFVLDMKPAIPLADTINGAGIVPALVLDMIFAIPLADTVNGATLVPTFVRDTKVTIPLATTIAIVAISPAIQPPRPWVINRSGLDDDYDTTRTRSGLDDDYGAVRPRSGKSSY